jgi:hypothetical protein
VCKIFRKCGNAKMALLKYREEEIVKRMRHPVFIKKLVGKPSMKE